MARQPAHGRHAHRIAEAHAGLPVSNLNGEFPRSLQAGVFAPRQRPDARLAAAAVDQELHAAAALGRAQAAGDLIIADFAHRAVMPTAAIQGRHATPLAVEKPDHPLSMPRCHVAQQDRRLLIRPPALIVCAQVLQDGRQLAGRLPGRFGNRQLHEWQTRIGLLEIAYSAGTHPGRRPRRQRPLVGRIVPAHRHGEKARATLRREPAGIDHRQVKDVSKLRQKAADLGKIASPVRRKKARHVLQQHGGRRVGASAPRRQQLQKRPHRSRMLAGQAGPITGQGQVDAGEGCRDQIDVGGELINRQVVDVVDHEVPKAKAGVIHFRLAGRDVVGEHAPPTQWLDGLPNQADSRKKLGERRHARFQLKPARALCN